MGFPSAVTSNGPGGFINCVYFMTGTPEGSTKSDFLEKPGIEPATSEVSHMRRFKSFAARLCDKAYKFMSWVT